MGALAFTYVCMRAHLSVGGNIASGTTTRATPGKALPRRERCFKPQRPPACPQRQAYRKHDRVAPPLSDPHFRVACDQPVRTQRKSGKPRCTSFTPRRWGILPKEKHSPRDMTAELFSPESHADICHVSGHLKTASTLSSRPLISVKSLTS